MKIGDEILIHGFVDEIRKDAIIVRNDGGYFGTTKDEVYDLVRCEACEHRGGNYCYKHSHRVTDSDFCSYGERCYIPYGERKE